MGVSLYDSGEPGFNILRRFHVAAPRCHWPHLIVCSCSRKCRFDLIFGLTCLCFPHPNQRSLAPSWLLGPNCALSEAAFWLVSVWLNLSPTHNTHTMGGGGTLVCRKITHKSSTCIGMKLHIISFCLLIVAFSPIKKDYALSLLSYFIITFFVQVLYLGMLFY